MNEQYRKNLKAISLASKNYTDKEIKASEDRILSIVARNNVDFIDHINEPTYRFTAPANSKLLMLQSIAGNSNKITPSTPSDDSVARLKTIPDNTYKSQVDYIGGKTVKYNQLVELANNTQSFTANIDTTKTIQTNISCNANDKLLVVWYQNTTLTSNTRNTMQYTTISDGVSNYQSTSTNNNLTSGLKSWFIQPSGSFNLKYWGSMLSNDLTISNIEVINLTRNFGAGNEPSTVETAITLLKADGYKLDGTDEYSTGSLKHAVVSGVKYAGNEFDYDTWYNATAYTEQGYTVRNYPVKPNTTYTLSIKELKNNQTVGVYLLQPNTSLTINGEGYIGLTSTYISQPQTFTTDNSGFIKIGYASLVDIEYLKDNMMLVKGTTVPSTYIPYVTPITKAMPSEVLALDGYGWGVNSTCYNYVDFNSKKFVKKSNKKSFDGTEDWYEYNNPNYYGVYCSNIIPTSNRNANISILGKFDNGQITYINGLCVWWGVNNTQVYIVWNPQDYATALSYGWANSDGTPNLQGFITWLTNNGLEFIFEMTTPVETDISQYLTTNWNKVDLDKQYATCEMVVDEPIDMPNKVEYYGTIIHSLATAVKQDGFNLFNKATAVSGYISDVTGDLKPSSTLSASDYIPVFPNQTLYAYGLDTSDNYGAYYDINKNYIQSANFHNGETSVVPSNAYYLRKTIGRTSYIDTACINISNQDLNGTYKPYKAPITRLLPNSEEKYSWGITDGVRNTRVFCDDECNPINEGQLDVGNQDLGESNWSRQTDGASPYFRASLTDVASSTLNVLCAKFDTVAWNVLYNSTTEKCCGIYYSQYILVRDNSYETVPAFKTAMSGEPLFYQKNATGTETLDDFDFSFDCEEGDTFTIIGCELLQCYATYSFLIKEAKSNE